MNRKQTKLAVLAAAISTPGLLAASPAISSEMPVEELRLAQTEGSQSLHRMQQFAQVKAPAPTRTAEPSEQVMRQDLQRELQAMTPAMKKEIGEDRIARIQRMSSKQLMDAAVAAGAGKCVSHGVGCKGTPAFSKGFICCIVAKL